MPAASKVHRATVARTAQDAKRRHKRRCRSAPSVGDADIAFRRREIGKREWWRAGINFDLITTDVAGRDINVEGYMVEMRAVDASGEPVETNLQLKANRADGEDFTVHGGSAPTHAKGGREINAAGDVIKKTLTGLTGGIECQVSFYARKATDAANISLRFFIWNVTDGVEVTGVNKQPDTKAPRVTAQRKFTPVGGKTYEARVSHNSGTTDFVILHHIQWHDKGNHAVWRQFVPDEDAGSGQGSEVTFQRLARPKSWYYQARYKVLNRVSHHKCWSAWSAWTNAVAPGTGDVADGPPAPTGVNLVLDKVEGSRRNPWRARTRWNETPWWFPADDEPMEGAIRYRVQLQVSNNGGSTVANTRTRTVAAEDFDTGVTNQLNWFNIKGKRHYRTRVQAIGEGNRRSAWSAYTSWASPGGAPNPVQNLTWDNITPALLVAKWEDPVDPSDIDRFRVRIFRQPGLVLVEDAYTYSNRFRYSIPQADRDNAHRVRVTALEEDISLDEDDAAPTGYTAPDPSTDVESTDLTATEVWTGAEVPADATDGNPPTNAPTAVTVLGGIGSLFVSWTAITNADPVKYEVHASETTGFTPDSTTLVMLVDSTMASFRKIPAGDDLVPGVTYFVKVLAVDADGAGPASTQASGTPGQVNHEDLAVDAVLANNILAGSVRTEHLDAIVTLTSMLRTAEAGQRVEISDLGYFGYDSNGNPIVGFPNVGNPFLRATLEALGLDVTGKATFRSPDSVMDSGSTFTMRGKIADPATAPSLVQTVPTATAHAGVGANADCEYPWFDGTNVFMTRFQDESQPEVVKFSADVLTEVAGVEPPMPSTGGTWHHFQIVRVGSHWYALTKRGSDNDWRWIVWDNSGTSGLPGSQTAQGGYFQDENDDGLSSDASLTTDGTKLYTLQRDGGGTDGIIKVFTPPGTGAVPTYDGAGSNVAIAKQFWNVSASPVPFIRSNADFGAARYIFRPRYGSVSQFETCTTSGTFQANETFPSAEFSVSRGFWYNSGFKELKASQAAIWAYTGWVWTTESAVYWVRYTWSDNTNESARSPVGSITMLRRRQLQVTSPDLPSGITEIRIYMDRGSSEPTLDHQGDSATKSAILTTFTAGGAAPPTVTTLPSGTPAIIQSGAGEWRLKGDGTTWGFQMLGEPLKRSWAIGDDMMFAGTITPNVTPMGPMTAFITAGASIVGQVQDGDHIGIARFDSGTATNGHARLVGGAVVLGSGRIRFTMCVKNGNKPTTAQNFTSYGGFNSVADPEVTAGTNEQLMIIIDRTDDTTMRVRIRAANASGVTDNTIIASEDTGWHTYAFEVAADGSAADVFRDGVLVTTISANMPTAEINPRIGTLKEAGTTARGMHLDYYSYQGELDTPR